MSLKACILACADAKNPVKITLEEGTSLQPTDYVVHGFLLLGTCFHLWLGSHEMPTMC